MKKMFITLVMVASVLVSFAKSYDRVYDKEATSYELVNDHTMIFHNVERIEIQQADSCTTRIVNWSDKRLIACEKGSFSVNVTKGDYLVQSQTPFTKTSTKDVYYDYYSLR